MTLKKLSVAVAMIVAGQAQAATGPSSSQTPYVIPTAAGVSVTSILTVGDSVGGYKMVGIPDGLGAYDNGNGTFTVLMDHELGNTSGIARAHGGKGAFVSEWVINKNTLAVVSGNDLIKNVYGWNTGTQTTGGMLSNVSFNRFCSADLALPSAFYNASTGMGSNARIFLNGEEGGANGWAMAHVASGADKGNSYILGRFNLATNGSGVNAVGGWENLLANPYAQDKTVVIGTNDGGTGIMGNSLAVYVGTKTNTGSEADKAGLTNGTLKFVNVAGNTAEIVNSTTRATSIASGTAFTLGSAASTAFSRPEDGAWSPDGSKFYFVTTDRIDQVTDGVGTQVGRSRLWRLNFTDITNPDAGGTIDMLLDGTEGGNMFDNMTIAADGKKLILQEDTGNAVHNAKTWEYDIASDTLTQMLKSDPGRFGDIGVAATAPFNADEENSGVIEVTSVLGRNDGKRYFLATTQAHYNIAGELVEGGQLYLVSAPVPEPETYAMMLAGLGLVGFMMRRNRP